MLLASGMRHGCGPHRLMGGVNAAVVDRGWWAKPGALRNLAAGEACTSGQSTKAGIPNGYTHPAAWVLPQKPGGLGSYLGASGSGSLSGAGALGVNGSAAITGVGAIDSATAQLVVSALASLTGSGAVSASLLAFVNGVDTMAGAGDLTGVITAIGWLLGDLAGTGTVTSTGRGDGELAADITPFTDLSPQSLASAVWASQEGTFLYALAHNKVVTDPTAGTMTVYDSDGTTVLFSADLFEDVAGATPYAGAGAERREAFA